MQFREAFVLHARPWRDTSLLLDLLVHDQGRVRAVARGMRGGVGKRRAANPCQVFSPLLVVLRGRTELKILHSVEPHRQPFQLVGQALFAGLYANELLVRSLPETELNNRLFVAYDSLLGQLAVRGADLEPPLRTFERTLLSELGYGVYFFHDGASGAPLHSEVDYVQVPQAGFIAVDARHPGADAAVYRGDTLLKVGRGELDTADSRRVAKRVMRQALKDIIGERPLQSRLLLASRRGARPTSRGR